MTELPQNPTQNDAPMISGNLFVGQLVRLTAMRGEDREILARWSTDSEYLRLLNTDPARPRAPEYFNMPSNSPRSYEFMLRTLAEDRLIGFMDLWVDWTNQTSGLAIGIGEPEYRGRGYGPDALRLALGYAFRELNLYRVGLNVFSYNTRAIRAYEKVGFQHEGRIRGWLLRDGRRHDLIYMGILRENWFAALGWPEGSWQ